MHGTLPPALAAFLCSDAHWDTRLAAWLLYILRSHAVLHSPLWTRFVRALPQARDLHLLCMFAPEEQQALQIPWCAALIMACKDDWPCCSRSHASARAAAASRIACKPSHVYVVICMLQLQQAAVPGARVGQASIFM